MKKRLYLIPLLVFILAAFLAIGVSAAPTVSVEDTAWGSDFTVTLAQGSGNYTYNTEAATLKAGTLGEDDTLVFTCRADIPSGTYELLYLDGVCVASFTVYEMGDANMDGKVNTRDAVLVKQSIVGMTELSDVQKAYADVVADGKINTRDVVLTLQDIVGMDVVLDDRVTVSFLNKDGSVYATRGVKKGGALTVLPEVPMSNLAGYEPYWNLAGIDLSAVTADITVPYAEKTVEYTVTYHLDGGKNGTGNPTSYTVESATKALADASKMGYTFVGWYTDASFGNKVTEITKGTTGNLDLYAKFEINDYTITFVSNGGSAVAPITQNYNTTVSAPKAPTKSGYVFGGWYTDAALSKAYTFTKMPAENVTLYAKWNVETYTVTYHLDGGKNGTGNPTSYTVESATKALADASKMGYTFVGWYSDASFKNKVTEIAKGTTGNLDLYAKFEINDYTITFVSNGGSAVAPITQNYNTTVSAPKAPTKSGYVFGGWYTDAALSKVYTFSKMPAENVTLYAKWNIETYTVTYHLDGGKNGAGNPANYTVESATKALADASKMGYTFVGWYTDASFGNKVTEITKGTTGKLDLYAKFEVITYNLTFILESPDGKTNGYYADKSNPATYTVEDTFTFYDLICGIKGYTFKGWYTEKEEGYKWDGITAPTTGDLTFYAQWTLKDYAITYDDGDADSNTNPTEYTVETPTFTLADPVKRGYKFLGWYSDSAKTVPADTKIEKGSVGDLAFYAKWEAVSYTVTYEADGGTHTGNAANYTILDSFSLNAAEKKGYTFLGWYTDAGFTTSVTEIVKGTTGSLTLYAKFEIDRYTVTYHLDGGKNGANPHDYTIADADITLLDATKTGFSFMGWYTAKIGGERVTEIKTAELKNVTLYARFVQYDLTYVLPNGATHENPATYCFDTVKLTLSDAALTGYTFGGWFLDDGFTQPVSEIKTASAKDYTLYAKFTVNQYSIKFDSSGGTDIDTIEQDYATAVAAPTAPVKRGYSFLGWFTAKGDAYTFTTMPAYNTTLYAKWEKTVYTVSYELDGGTHSGNVTSYTIDQLPVSLKTASKEGYTFRGWYTDSAFADGTRVTSITDIPEYGTVTYLYAKFEINTYKLSFNTNGGSSIDAVDYLYGATTKAPTAPEKTGYTFAGWYSDSRLTKEYAFGVAMPASNVTLYAKWTPVTYTVTYHLNGGTNVASNPATFTIENSKITLATPTKAGGAFLGWYSDAEFTNKVTEIASGTHENITLHANWELAKYKISYQNTKGADNANPAFYTVDDGMLTLLDIRAKGFRFLGWYSDSACTKKVTAIDSSKMTAVTLYAKWETGTYTVYLDRGDDMTFTVTFDAQGGSDVASQTVTDSNALRYPTAPTRDGYVFRGWYTTADCTGKAYDFTDTVYGDMTLYAGWVEAEHALAVGGASSVTVDGKNLITYIVIPYVSGNVTLSSSGSLDLFGYLYDANGNLLASNDDISDNDKNFALTANLTANAVYYLKVRGYSETTSGSATLKASGKTTVADGGKLPVSGFTTLTYGEGFTLNVPAEIEGYTFEGWYTEPNGKGVKYAGADGKSVKNWDIDEDTTLYSYYRERVYTVTFVTGSGSKIDAITVAYGDRLDLSSYVTTRTDGYVFAGWLVNGELYEATTMPDHALTLTAKWVRFALGSIKYDTTKTAISIHDKITPELFGIVCFDVVGKEATYAVTMQGTQAAGETVTVRVVVTGGNAQPKQITISNIKVYGDPTATHSGTKDYFNLEDGLSASWFGAAAKDTYGTSLTVTAEIEGEYKGGDVVTVLFKAKDAAGNVTTVKVENVKVYGTPEITVEKTDMKTSDTISTEIFYATAVDSFGEALTVTASRYSGTVAAGNTVRIKFTTTDSKGNTATVYKSVKVYGTPTISSASNLHFKVTDTVIPEAMGVTAKDSFGTALSMTLTVKSGEQAAGKTMVVTLTATDHLGNVKSTDFTLSFYTTPTIICDRTDIKVTENAASNPTSVLGAKATDSFGNSLTVTCVLKEGTVAGGNTVVYTLTATDRVGNTHSVDVSVKVYDVADILFKDGTHYFSTNSDLIKLASKGEEFAAATLDSFGEPCTITVRAASGYTLAAGKTINLVLVAIDKAGNEVVGDVQCKNIKVYGMPTVSVAGGHIATLDDISFLVSVKDSFSSELYSTLSTTDALTPGTIVRVIVAATDDAGNTLREDITITICGRTFVPAQAPTCFDAGNVSYYKCDCGKCFEDIEAGNEIVDVILPKAPHKFTNGVCAKCGKVLYTRRGSYIYFGEYPQSLKASNVSITSTKDSRGYYLGSDGFYYAKVKADPDGSGYQFSTGAGVVDGTTYYFKVEPIRWRILSESGGNALILCDSIIAKHRYDDSSNNYKNSEIRTWLNGTFYETAFSALQKDLINTVLVDNSVASTGYSSNPYACENTSDKVFLLSYKEVTNPDYGFSSDGSNYDTARRKTISDYARATGAYMHTGSSSYGNGWWRLRSPSGISDYYARAVDYNGLTGYNRGVDGDYYGVVPALQIRLG